ncbi:origin recognition complex subunit 1 [Meredithblackwellia eburnea MCA 4105]
MTTFEKAKTMLHVSATPESLPRRDAERARISELLGMAILNQTGTCIYISGVPGTGKTATVHSVVRELQHDEVGFDMDAFHFVEINGMKVSDPSQSFTLLWEALSGKKASPRQALTNLEEHFQTPDPTRKTTVVLVDELDQMITKKQDVIYNFFNWPHVAHSRLIVVAVANTMDLPERELSGKIRSRLGSNRISFTPYTWQDLEAILQARLEGLEVIQPLALQRIAKSIAGVAGDARRALDVARYVSDSNLELVEKKDQANRESGKIELCTMSDVHQTYTEMTNYGSNLFLKRLSFMEKFFLLGVVQCARRAGVPDVELDRVMQWCFDFLRQTGITPVPSHADFFDIVAKLYSLRLIATESQRYDYFQRLRSLVENDELLEVLKDDSVLKKYLPKLST